MYFSRKVVSIILGLLCCTCLLAQSTGRISGKVVDPVGAVVPGAQVFCTNSLTGVATETVTNSEGIFRFPDLPIGTYDISVSHQGFQKLVRSGTELLTGHSVELRLALVVGEVSESVMVTAEVPIVQTDTSEVQTTIDSRSMRELPLNGRNPMELVALTAGADFTDEGTIVGQQDNTGITVNGLPATDNNFQLDGAGYNNPHFGSAPTLPNPDTLQEFTVQSSNFSARESRAGAVVQLSTRSGTNDLHGSVFEFLRNEKLDARNFFDADRSPFKRSQAGGTLGGPVVRNRTFFFGSYQGTVKRGGPSPKLITIPNEELRQGDFSSRAGSIVVDPLTGQPFPGSIIPVSRFDPASVKVMSIIPLPNRPGGTVRLPKDEDQNDHQFLAKIDHQLSTNHRLTARYFFDQNNFQRDLNSVPGTYSDNIFRNQIFTLRSTHSFSANLTAVGSFSYTRTHRTQNPIAPMYNQDFTDKFPLATTTGRPELRVNIANYVNLNSGGSLEFGPWTWGARFQLAWSHGRHLVQFGVDFERNNELGLDDSGSAGNYTFNATRTRNTAIKGSVGDSFASFLLGLPATFTQSGSDFQKLTESKYQPWIQDDWKVTSTFTLNLGLRWEPWLPAYDREGPLPGLMPGIQSKVAPDAPAGLVFSGDVRDSVFPRDWNNLAPRVGFAWDIAGSGKTIIRSGYGIYYRAAPLNLQRHGANTAAFRGLIISFPEPDSFVDPYVSYPGGTPFPFRKLSASELQNYKFARPVTTAALDPFSPASYTQSWNLSVERRILRDTSLTAAYVANHSVKVVAGTEGNPALYGPGATAGNINNRRIFPGLASVTFYTPWQAGNYNALQINVIRRTRRGLSIVANYVFAKAIDYGTGGTVGGLAGKPRDPFNLELDRAVADYDVAHRANISFVYDTPRLVYGSGPAATLLNNWQVNSILTIQSGKPVTVLAGSNRSLNGLSLDHADIVGDPARPAGVDPVQQWFNTAAFVIPDIGTFGNVGRNTLRGPGRAVINLSVFKNFPLSERLRLQFRTEAFNLFNRANFGSPVASVSNRNYGQILSAADPRVVQFALKLIF